MIESARYVEIYFPETKETYNTKTNGFYIQNYDCVGAPELNTNYIQIPGASGLIDLSEALTGYPTYKSREIKIELAGKIIKNDRQQGFNRKITDVYQKLEGRVAWLRFYPDNQSGEYYIGRMHIKDVSCEGSIMRFTISVPDADPGKYYRAISGETSFGEENIPYGASKGYEYTFAPQLLSTPIRFETSDSGLKVRMKRATSSFIEIGELNVGETYLPKLIVGGGVETTIIVYNSVINSQKSFMAYYREARL